MESSRFFVGLIMNTFHAHILWVSLHYKCWACLAHLLAYKWVKTYWGIPFETQGKIFRTLNFILFFTKPNSYPRLPPYFSCQMKQISSNLIYESIVFFFFFIYESKNNKIYPMWAMFYQWPPIPKFFTFWNLYIAIGHLVFVTFECFIHIST
jgi:hypothetical protein